MAKIEAAYTIAMRGLRAALPLLGRGSGKIARGVRGRRGVLSRMSDWAPGRDPSRPLVWFHAASVGEGLQARAVLEVFRRRNPEAQVAYTFFSPSAEALAASIPADFADYLPLDLPEEVGRALDLLEPDVIAFSKGDVWPNLTREASRRGVRMALLSATLPPTSSRLAGPARLLLSSAYRRLDRAAAISEADADRLADLGVPPDRRLVMGDSHFDRVLARADAVERASDLLRPLAAGEGELTLVAGSTWAADEERLLPLLADGRRTGWARNLRLVVVPHEPTPAHLNETEARLARLGMPHRRLSALGRAWSGDEVLLVDRVGVLAELYAIADLAYVGGGWGRTGLHSVLEPAAYGVPVLFGPRHANAREAGELLARGAAFRSRDADELERELRALVSDPSPRAAAGAAARAYVEAGRGAAERGARILEELLPRG